jgi:pre-mRNA-splicing factor RBM22/SLT11
LAHQNIKDRYHGVNDPVANKILGRVQNSEKPTPPEDPDAKTVYLGGITEDMSEIDIRYSLEFILITRNALWHYGEIIEVKLLPQQHIGFVTYATRANAENAVDKLWGNCTINEIQLKVSWAKSQIHDQRTLFINETHSKNPQSPKQIPLLPLLQKFLTRSLPPPLRLPLPSCLPLHPLPPHTVGVLSTLL